MIDLSTPAPLTAADALAMCVASAAVGAAIVIVILILWIECRRRDALQRERIASRTILQRM